MSEPTLSTRQWYNEFYRQRPKLMTPWYKAAFRWLIENRPVGPLLELGCGNGVLLAELQKQRIFSEEDIFGLEQSEVAIRDIQKQLPNVRQGNVEGRLPFDDGFFGVAVMTEVLEHLLDPWAIVGEVHRITRPDGIFILSFPNYLNFPWLVVRVLGELLDRPNWTVLQPIDRLFAVPVVIRKMRERGFLVRQVIGKVFLPPILNRIEPDWFDDLLNGCRLSLFGLHPVIILRKRSDQEGP